MRDINKNTLRETQAVFALTVVLLNFLILAVVIGFVWSLQILLSPNSPLSAALSETLWR
jgi:nitrate reductase NapE component